jgi:hypothetical protein
MLIIIIKSSFELIKCWVNFKLAIFKSEKCDSLNTLRLFHKDNKIMFIILYKHYLSKISKLKNQLPKLIIEI